MSLSREQAIEIIESVLATQYSAFSLGFRDVMVKNNQVSVTVLGASQEQQHAIEATLFEMLKASGAAALYCRFRGGDTPSGSNETSSVKEDKPKASNNHVKGHAAGMNSTLLNEQPNVEFIAIASGKGGVGKSTVTVNLATALARIGKKVAIIDADIYGFSVPDMMGIEERPQVVNDRVIPIERFGVKVISMGFFVEDNSPIVWRGPMLGKMLRNFFTEIEWGSWIMFYLTCHQEQEMLR